MAWHICALGDLLEDLPEWDGIVWQRDPSQACDAAMVYGDIDQGEWLAAGRSLSPLVPVGIVGRAPGFLRGDFASPTLAPPAIEEMLAAFTPIRERLGELPPIVAPGQRDFDKLAILGLAYSRGRAIEAERTPSAPETVTYPLLQGRPGLESAMPRTDLEGLANIDLLERRFFTRVLTCSACTSGRMCAFEACVECGSAHLSEEPIIHHYRCGFQDGESRFMQGVDLVCPKCKHELRHFGVDYGRPGTLVRCSACQQVMTEPQPAFHCLDCQATVRGEQATAVDWHTYVLTERGISAARIADVPHFDIAVMTRAFARTYPVKDFILLAQEQLLVSGRYQRPMAIGAVTIRNLPAMREKIGGGGASEIINLLIQIIVESLRETDFATVPKDDTLMVAMPETEKVAAELVLGRIRVAAGASLAFPVEIGIDVVDGDGAIALLGSLTA